MQQLVERRRLDAADGFFLRDQPFLDHINGDLHGGAGGAFAGTGLEHPELAALDGEFQVLHVAIVVFQPPADRQEFAESFRHQLFHGRLVGAGDQSRSLGDGLRRADARHNVFSLRIDEEFTV